MPGLQGLSDPPIPELAKAATGISGFDDITGGGLPNGRPTLVCGGPGCGKTLFGMTFLVKGASDFGEPGVFMSFEERATDLEANFASLGFDIAGLIADRKLAVDHVHIERSEIEETGEYDLEGLFVRLGYAIDSIGAKRVVLDTIEALFSGLSETGILRAELRRLFRWLKERGVSAVVTGERSERQLTRHGLEEYVSDCVILLDNRVDDQITTRRLRIIKYRGSAHGTNEYPFLIDRSGIRALPITSARLSHETTDEVVSTGIAKLDAMLTPGGYYRGSSVLVSGLAGTGKTTFGAKFIDAACRRGERCMIFAFEESPEQIVRNMRSVGIDLSSHAEAGLLRFEAARPSLYGYEQHLAGMYRDVDGFAPSAMLLDPISSFRGPTMDIYAMLLRMIDMLKNRNVTAVLTSLGSPDQPGDNDDRLVSSLMDTWISLRDIEDGGERNRGLYILKSRGMQHSNRIYEYVLTSTGVDIIEPHPGSTGLVTGSARVARESQHRSEAQAREQELKRRQRDLERERLEVKSQLAELERTLAEKERELHELAAADSSGAAR